MPDSVFVENENRDTCRNLPDDILQEIVSTLVYMSVSRNYSYKKISTNFVYNNRFSNNETDGFLQLIISQSTLSTLRDVEIETWTCLNTSSTCSTIKWWNFDVACMLLIVNCKEVHCNNYFCPVLHQNQPLVPYPVLQIWTNVFLNVGSYKHVHSKNGITKNDFIVVFFGNTFIIARPNTYELMSWIEWKANTPIKS